MRSPIHELLVHARAAVEPKKQCMDRSMLRRMSALMRYAAEGVDVELAWAAQPGGLFRLPVIYGSLRPGDAPVVLDVGAADGRSALDALRIFPNAAVYSFEPRQDAFCQLRREAATHRNWRAFNLALAAHAGTRELLVFQHAGESSSFYPVSEHWIQGWPSVNFGSTSSESVTVAALDDVSTSEGIGTVDILKLDVQGAELEVLQGGARTLERTRHIIVEHAFVPGYSGGADFIDVFSFLRDRRFAVVAFENFQRNPQGRLIQCDALYTRFD